MPWFLSWLSIVFQQGTPLPEPVSSAPTLINGFLGSSLAVQWLGLFISTVRGHGFDPGWEVRSCMPLVAWPKKNPQTDYYTC